VLKSELTAVSSVETELNQERRLELPTSYRRLEFGDLCLSDFEDILSKSGRRSFAHCPKSAPSATTAAITPTLHTATSQRCFDFVFWDDFSVDTGLLSAVMYLPLTPMPWKEMKRFSIECREAETKVIILTNHKEQRQSSEPIKTFRNQTQQTQSAGKHGLVLLLIGGRQSSASF